MNTEQRIYELIDKSDGYLSRGDLSTRSLYYAALELVRAGKLLRVKPGVFALPDRMAALMYDVDRIVPGAVVCTYSAWSHYGLTTQIPLSLCLAIGRGRKISLPDYPPITLYYVSDSQLKLGAVRDVIDGIEVPIYDIERCVCDAIKYRNKIGIDVCSEIVNNYLKRKDGKNIVKLCTYAKSLRVYSTLQKYLEIAL